MLFVFIVFLTALLMEGIGSYISVVGLNSIFAGDLVIIAMAVILDIAKVVTVSFLYKTWETIRVAMKTYLTVAVITLMTITSVGAFGYLSGAFQKAMQPNREVAMKLETKTLEKNQLDKEKTDLVARQKSIDDQVAKLPDDYVQGRTRLLNSFKEDKRNIQSRLNVVDKRLIELNQETLTLKGSQLEQDVHVGPITFVSKAFGIPMEDAVKYVILTIIFVFDPLAIMLVIAGNYLLDERKKPVTEDESEEIRIEEPEEEPDDLRRLRADLKRTDDIEPGTIEGLAALFKTAKEIEEREAADAEEPHPSELITSSEAVGEIVDREIIDLQPRMEKVGPNPEPEIPPYMRILENSAADHDAITYAQTPSAWAHKYK
jgi:hypothetical protein